MKLAPPNCRCIIKSWQISCRYVYVFRKSNSIYPINHNLSFCEAKLSFPFVKYKFMKTHFTGETLDLASQKLRLWPIGMMEFKFLKIKIYLREILQLFMIHLQFGNANFMGQSHFKGKNCWKIHFFSEWILKFHKQVKNSNTNQYLRWKL